MKFVSYRHEGQVRVGAVDPDAGLVQPVSDPGGSGVATSLLDVISMVVQGGISSVRVSGGALELATVELLPPIPVPARNIMCVGKNYKEHSEEFSRSGFDATGSSNGELPAHPIFFTKPPSAVIGPGVPIEAHPGVTEAIDYEAEVAIIIGRPGRSIRPEDAWDHVWGYTLLNDVTARDLQHRHEQ